MSIQAVAWALEQDLPARPKLVLVSIANHANHTDGYCWLKAETIAAEAACSRRGVFNFVGDLIRNGYVRKAPKRAEDGKQRANDYWIILNRAPAEWIHARADEADAVGDDPDTGSPEAPDVVPRMNGVHSADESDPPPSNPVEMSPRALGPSAPVCTHIDSAEPSKTNPKKADPSPAVAAGLRAYRAPPPQPIGAVTEGPKQQIFVFENTKAWLAWRDHIKRTEGRTWSLTTRVNIDGQWKTGWWWPTLFPPSSQPKAGADPPHQAA